MHMGPPWALKPKSMHDEERARRAAPRQQNVYRNVHRHLRQKPIAEALETAAGLKPWGYAP